MSRKAAALRPAQDRLRVTKFMEKGAFLGLICELKEKGPEAESSQMFTVTARFGAEDRRGERAWGAEKAENPIAPRLAQPRGCRTGKFLMPGNFVNLVNCHRNSCCPRDWLLSFLAETNSSDQIGLLNNI
jgi:hypothetical protein